MQEAIAWKVGFVIFIYCETPVIITKEFQSSSKVCIPLPEAKGAFDT
ncbi:MAG: hypothetical protein QW115_00395 [Thermoplasmata archaeon]